MDELRHFLYQFKASNIFQLQLKTEPSTDGHPPVKTIGKYACRVGTTPLELVIDWGANTFTIGTNFTQLLNCRPLTEDEFNKCAAGKQPLDTPEAVLKVRREDLLAAKMNLLSPPCPICRKKMLFRSGRQRDFWDCPQCSFNQSMSPEHQLMVREYRQFGAGN